MTTQHTTHPNPMSALNDYGTHMLYGPVIRPRKRARACLVKKMAKKITEIEIRDKLVLNEYGLLEYQGKYYPEWTAGYMADLTEWINAQADYWTACYFDCRQCGGANLPRI